MDLLCIRASSFLFELDDFIAGQVLEFIIPHHIRAYSLLYHSITLPCPCQVLLRSATHWAFWQSVSYCYSTIWRRFTASDELHPILFYKIYLFKLYSIENRSSLIDTERKWLVHRKICTKREKTIITSLINWVISSTFFQFGSISFSSFFFQGKSWQLTLTKSIFFHVFIFFKPVFYFYLFCPFVVTKIAFKIWGFGFCINFFNGFFDFFGRSWLKGVLLSEAKFGILWIS